MRYIIMAGRSLTNTELPKHLWEVGDETVIGRTIRLLKKYGVKDIAISTQDKRFEQFGLKLLHHHNPPKTKYFINAFYPTYEPTCYIFGDVVFSESAIKKIVETETDSIQFFASAPPFHELYPKRWAEPFAMKVVDTERFWECVNEVRRGIKEGIWKRDPLAWELWQVIKNTERNKARYDNYVAINDFTCDVDEIEDLQYYKDMSKLEKPEEQCYMIHTCPKREWYVNEYLIPSMLKQGIKESQITVYCDSDKQGNLRACMNSFLTLPDESGTWHLQDDVLLCRDFKKRTEMYNHGLVAGFISQRWNNEVPFGIVNASNMPWTFPCIRIPNKIAKSAAKWILSDIVGNPIYTAQTKDGNGDDWAFKLYLQTYHKNDKIRVLEPSLVEHIDWFIGGSSVGSKRLEPTVARRFDDQDLVEQLRVKLQKR